MRQSFLAKPVNCKATCLPSLARPSRRSSVVKVAAFLEDGHADGNNHVNGSNHANGLTGSNGHIGLPLSMFTPYKQLPPEGQMLAPEDTECDPSTSNCKTPIYTYESKCLHCGGTGFVKSRANGRHASMWTCLPCNGLGYVRRATARFVPATDDSLTLARPDPSPEAKARAARKERLKAQHAQHEQQGQALLARQAQQGQRVSQPADPGAAAQQAAAGQQQ